MSTGYSRLASRLGSDSPQTGHVSQRAEETEGTSLGIFTELRDGEDEPDKEPTGGAPEGTGSPVDAEAEGLAGLQGGETGEEEAPKPERDAKGRFSRRGFLGGTAVAAGVGAAEYLAHRPLAVMRRLPAHDRRLATSRASVTSAQVTPPIDPSYDLLIQAERDCDMLLLDFYFYNFTTRVDGFGVTNIVPTDADNYIIVRFPPQSIAEGVYWATNGTSSSPYPDQTGLLADPSPILSALSGPSQLSFTLPEDAAIPLTNNDPTDLLCWSEWPLNVPVVAQAPQQINANGEYPLPEAPGSFDTFIEFPYCLYLSPSAWAPQAGDFDIHAFSTTFHNTVTPVEDAISSNATVVDIFTSTLQQVPVFTEAGYQRGLSAVWAQDLPTGIGIASELGNATPETVIFYGEAPT